VRGPATIAPAAKYTMQSYILQSRITADDYYCGAHQFKEQAFYSRGIQTLPNRAPAKIVAVHANPLLTNRSLNIFMAPQRAQLQPIPLSPPARSA
jgi:hypothetical protein